MKKWTNRDEFYTCVHEWAQKLDIEVKTVSIRPMKNKWASYTKRNDLLLFNSELMALDRELGNYVIVHELLHFRVPNHGRLWKSLMRAHLGEYEEMESKLKVLASKREFD